MKDLIVTEFGVILPVRGHVGKVRGYEGWVTRANFDAGNEPLYFNRF